MWGYKLFYTDLRFRKYIQTVQLYSFRHFSAYIQRGPYEYIETSFINLLKPTGHVMHQQFNIQQLYVLLTLYLCVLYLSENK